MAAENGSTHQVNTINVGLVRKPLMERHHQTVSFTKDVNNIAEVTYEENKSDVGGTQSCENLSTRSKSVIGNIELANSKFII